MNPVATAQGEMFTSHLITPGQVYSRAALKQRFSIRDATINTGVFQPKGHRSVWLFVTEKKTVDRTQYLDRLEVDRLYWQGQTSGRTDGLIQKHEAHGLELLLFYRLHKTEHPGAGFRYEGQFRYATHVGRNPASFLLLRVVELATQPVQPWFTPAPLTACLALSEPSPASLEPLPASNWVDVLAQLCTVSTISFANLRARLLPLDLLPNAVIDDINEHALDLTGEMALLESGDSVEVQQDVLKHVITAICGQSVFTPLTN